MRRFVEIYIKKKKLSFVFLRVSFKQVVAGNRPEKKTFETNRHNLVSILNLNKQKKKNTIVKNEEFVSLFLF